MAIDSDIRDQAYQFFIQEAPELLQLIETDLLTLREDRTTAKIHNMMRAAHSIKGGAASVGLETIKTLAHSVEDIFKGLHNPELIIDPEVENLLLQAYDCLRLPLMEQINTGQYDSEQAMATAEPVFAQIEAQLGEYLKGGAGDIPSSVELGVDIAASIFEVDVAQGLERLEGVLAAPQGQEVEGELRAQAEVFAGLAELLNLPGFGAIAHTAIAALDQHSNRAIEIATIALADFQAARQAVLNGERQNGGAPSEALKQLATANAPVSSTTTQQPVAEINNFNFAEAEPSIAALDDLFGENTVTQTPEISAPQAEPSIAALDDLFGEQQITQTPEISAPQAEPSIAALDDLFGEQQITQIPEISAPQADTQLLQQIFDAELVEQTTPSLEDLFGDCGASKVEPATTSTAASTNGLPAINPQASIQEIVQSVEQVFDSLPAQATDNSSAYALGVGGAIIPATENLPTVAPKPGVVSTNTPATQKSETAATAQAAQLSVRVDLERLERMNNLVGELAINRNSLSLQNVQMQATVQELLRRFAKFQEMGRQLRDLSDLMLVAPQQFVKDGDRSQNPESRSKNGLRPATLTESRTQNSESNSRQLVATNNASPLSNLVSLATFDSLEMDSYGELHSLLLATLEEVVQLEETVGDVVLLAGRSSESLETQRQMLSYLRDDLMWARMLPLGELLNRFPRMLRDLSRSYDKPVDLKLNGTGVLVDKAALEKLYDPLLHLVRNAFDHGIEMPDVRQQQGKPAQGQIEIRAYHQANQTIIEVRDDGRGLNLDRIRAKAVEMGLLSPEQVNHASISRLLDLLFEPGFSTAKQVSELSGRGVGLDVVRSQLRSLKGNVTVSSEVGKGTIFTLRIPLTLSIAKLLVCFVGSTAFAMPSDSITEILIPTDQIKYSNGHRFLHWQERIVPAYKLSEILTYACPLPETLPDFGIEVVPSPDDWALPMLLIEQDGQIIALEVDRLVTEQELVIKPFGSAIAPPSYIYGCTILGDGNLIPVIDTAGLLHTVIGERNTALKVTNNPQNASSQPMLAQPASAELMALPAAPVKKETANTVLVVDDSITLRQTLALTLQKAGYRVLQARDGREAIEQLQQSTIQLVVCDVEMPNMNGFEFLSHRRQDPQLIKVPVVMLTSRSSDKHKQLAMHLGANSYFTKPYIEQEFVTAIKNIIQQNTSVKIPVA